MIFVTIVLIILKKWPMSEFIVPTAHLENLMTDIAMLSKVRLAYTHMRGAYPSSQDLPHIIGVALRIWTITPTDHHIRFLALWIEQNHTESRKGDKIEYISLGFVGHVATKQ